MSSHVRLDQYLNDWAKGDSSREPVAKTVVALASACMEIADLVAAGPLSGELSLLQADKLGGDFQTELDILANTHLVDALRSAPVAAVASEELDVPVELNPGAPILPGAMTLVARIGAVQVFGVPACALYFKTTSLDLLLPRLLA
ncbi:MAG: hypothetical protein P8Y53_01745, partial [Pseudolabrys sp.]